MTEVINRTPVSARTDFLTENRQRLAKTAAKMVIKVIGQNPVSNGRQAAALALECREKNLDPRELEEALATNREQLLHVTNAANNGHRGQRILTHVSVYEAASVIKYDFRLADLLFYVPADKLHTLIFEYKPRTITKLGAENRLKRHAVRLGKKYRRQHLKVR